MFLLVDMPFHLYVLTASVFREEVEVGEEVKREAQGKRVVIDKETGKAVEVDMYERGSKKRDPEKLKAIFSSNLEQSIMPADISKCLPKHDSPFLRL